MSEPSSFVSLRHSADQLAQRLRRGHPVLFEPSHPPAGIARGTVLMVDPLVHPIHTGEVVLILDPAPRLARVQRVRGHEIWIEGQAEPVPIEQALGRARTKRLSLLERARAWWGR